MDSLIDTIQKTKDPSQLKTLWFQIQQLLSNDVPFIPLFIPLIYQTVRKGVNGVPQNPFDLVPNYYNVSKA